MKFTPLFALVASAAMLTGCGEGAVTAKPLNVISGHIVLGATPDRPAVGYFTVQGGPQTVELAAVTAEMAQRVEMHETVKENGMTVMKPLERATVPAKGKLEFKQGGKHLMIWGINQAAIETGKLPMQFLFTNNNNDRILFDLVIKQPEQAAAGTDAATDPHAGH